MNINYELLKQVCLSPIEAFKSLGDVTTTKDGIYIYSGNKDAKILGVAHLDSVLNLNHFYQLDIDKDSIVVNAQLDDRLGAYILLDILPKLGINFDLLLTEGEETGRSTAAYFDAPKDYNWIFSFDRQLEDVVMYQYDCKELRSDLGQAKFLCGHGSFSDIAFLDFLGVRGINIGTGYYGEHSDMCYASMNMMIAQIKRFQTFYELFQDKKYTYDQTSTKALGRMNDNAWEDYNARYMSQNYVYDDICYICQKPSMNGEEYEGVFICEECLGSIAECQGCEELVLDTELKDGLCAYCRGES